jgi:murein DD-endopeptidase
MPRLWHSGTPPLTCGHQCHLNRGSQGGEDWGMLAGTPLYAPVSGTYRLWMAGDGSSVISGLPSDPELAGLTVRALHAKSSPLLTVGGASKFVNEGALVGYSGGAKGAWGAGPSTGPHVHEDAYLAGKRVAMTTAVAWAKQKLTPAASVEVDGTIESDEWRVMQTFLRGHGYVGPVDGVPGKNTYVAVQRWLSKVGGYTGTLDGVPGLRTWAALQRFLRGHGYAGAVDGIPGKLTWMAFQRFLNTVGTR